MTSIAIASGLKNEEAGMTTPHVAVLPGKGLPSDSAQQDPNEGKDEPTKVSGWSDTVLN